MFNLGGTTRDGLLAAGRCGTKGHKLLVLRIMHLHHLPTEKFTSVNIFVPSNFFHHSSDTTQTAEQKNNRFRSQDVFGSLVCSSPVAFYVACSLPSCKAVEESRCYAVPVPGMEYMANPCPPTVPCMLSV